MSSTRLSVWEKTEISGGGEAHYKENEVKTRRLDHIFLCLLAPAHDFSHSTCSDPTRLLLLSFDRWAGEATCPPLLLLVRFWGWVGFPAKSRAAEETANRRAMARRELVASAKPIDHRPLKGRPGLARNKQNYWRPSNSEAKKLKACLDSQV